MTATRRIHIVNRTARSVLKGSNMRTSTSLLLCSMLAACAQVGERGGPYTGPDAGSGSSARTCDDLQTVTGDLTITGTSGFTGLPESCWELQGKLTLRGPAITSLDKLGDIRTVASLEIDDTALTAVNTPSLIDVQGDVIIHNNQQLADIGNVSPRSAITSLTVEYNDSLTTLGGLSEVTRVTGPTAIDNNAKLATLDLSRAARLEGGLSITDNAALTMVKLDELSSVGAFTLRHNTALTTISSLAALQYIHGALTVDDNDKLMGLDSMSGSMTSIDGGISITGNAQLSDLGQLTHVGVVGGSVSISNNTALNYCAPQPFTCCVQIAGTLSITGNASTSCQQHSWCWNNGCPFNN